MSATGDRRTVLALCGVLAASACNLGTEDEAKVPLRSRIDGDGNVVLQPAERQAIGLSTIAVAEGTVTTANLRFGQVVARPEEEELVIAPVTSRVRSAIARAGTAVQKGDALIELEPVLDIASRASLEVQRHQLQGQLQGARATVLARQVDLERLNALVPTRLATPAQRADAEAQLRVEEGRVDGLAQALSAIERSCSDSLKLCAQTAGVLAAITTEVGASATQGTIVARILREGPRWIDIAARAEDQIGDAYRLPASPDAPIRLLNKGAIVHRDGARHDRLQCEPVGGSLLPGTTVAVEVLHTHEGLLLPSEAVVRHEGEQIVFVEIRANCFAPRTVKGIATDGKTVAISTGLARGERVVTLGSLHLLAERAAAGPITTRR